MTIWSSRWAPSQIILGWRVSKNLLLTSRKSADAIRIRNRVVDMFEQADAEPDPNIRKRLLTFVIAGGGFAGVELAGALNDFAHGILADYRSLSAKEISVILVHSRDRILPELSESLASYALEKMRVRGVNFRLANAPHRRSPRHGHATGPQQDTCRDPCLDCWNHSKLSCYLF